MPSTSERQRRFMGAELSRKRAGKRTKTGMSVKQLREFTGSVKKRKVKAGKHSHEYESREMREGMVPCTICGSRHDRGHGRD